MFYYEVLLIMVEEQKVIDQDYFLRTSLAFACKSLLKLYCILHLLK